MNKDFDAAIASFVAGCQKMIDDRKHSFPEKLVIRKGKKYAKIVLLKYTKDDGSFDTSYGSAYCFVNMENGNVLKPASWAAPAKHARGNIFDDHNGLKYMSWLGPAYLRN